MPLDNNNKFIKIIGDISKPKTIFYELDSNSINTSLSENNINLWNNNGFFRAIGKFSNDTITGRYQNKHGQYYNFSMTLDSLFTQKKEKVSINTC